MTVGGRGKAPRMGALWAQGWRWLVLVAALWPPTRAHDTQVNPYIDPYYGRPSIDPSTQPDQINYEEEHLSDDLAIQVRGLGERNRAIELANQYGLEYLDQVFENPPVFHFRKPRDDYNRRPRRDTSRKKLVEAISKDPQVEWVDQQIAFTREKRRIPVTYFRDLGHKTKLEEEETVQESLEKVLRGSRGEIEQISVSKPNSELGWSKFGRKGDENNDSEDNSDFGTSLLAEEKLCDSNSNDQNRHPITFNAKPEQDKNKLVRIPLYRHTGYGFGPVQSDIQYTRQNRLYGGYNKAHDDALRGRLYIPRDRQLKQAMDQLSINEMDSSNKVESRQDFGAWIDHLGDPSVEFNDPFYKDQWYLHNTGQLGRDGYDLNVTWAWLNGYTGQGILLSVLDDGLQRTNADIAKNYAPGISYSLVKDRGKRDDPSPRMDPKYSNSHGTYCAGIISAVGNNSICGVGVAYDAKVGGVRLVDGKVTDIQEATALSRYSDQVDIFSASWGPTDDGTKVEGPARLASHAFLKGVTEGRNGKGVIYVWASGNGGIMGDNCNLDGYTSSIYTLSVSALTDLGTTTFYEEPCASTLASVYVGGDHTLEEANSKKERNKKSTNVVVPELDGHCSANFQGTSAAAPLMAGVVALVLQANGDLTWRDVQHLVVETSLPTPNALKEDGWHINGRGKKFHLKQGFGAVNAGKMVAAAIHWVNVPPQKVIVVPMFSGHRDFDPFTWMNVTKEVDSSEVPPSERMRSVEHVIANLTLVHPMRKLLTMFIVSPSGTTSQVLTHRAPDKSSAGFKSWGFMSVHFWGETPEGEWKVAIKDDSGQKSFLKNLQLTIYGS